MLQWAEARAASETATVHETAPQHRTTQSKMPMVARRNKSGRGSPGFISCWLSDGGREPAGSAESLLGTSGWLGCSGATEGSAEEPAHWPRAISTDGRGEDCGQ